MADPEKDLYAVLGVSKSATQDEIRRVYKKLARQYHPDVNPGNASAEERFKEISAAYDVLSNADKRKLYDEFGHEGLRGGFDPDKARAYKAWSEGRRTTRGPMGGGFGATGGADEEGFEFDLGDLFGGMGGFGFGDDIREPRARARGPARGQDVGVAVEIDFVDALRGKEIPMRLPLRVECDRCGGKGDEPGTTPDKCKTCDGTGRAQVVRGPMRMLGVCPTCGGEGVVRTPCTKCGGSGVVESEQTVTVRIPPGADHGTQLTVRGKGHAGIRGGPPGDLVIETRVRPHPWFRREGLDLHLKLPVTVAEAYAGASIDVPTPDGTVKLKVPPRSQPGARLRLKGKGVERKSERGDLYVDLDVRLPPREDKEFEQAARAAEALYEKPVREGVRL